LSLAACDSDDSNTVKVERVVDGDTIVVSIDGVSEKVRLIGVDTPESVHPDKSKNVPYGKVATSFTKENLEEAMVTLEFDVQERDTYGRLLAYVYLDDVMFNKLLLDEGHAMVSTYPPNVKYVDVFTKAQETARNAGKGLWGYDDTAVESSNPQNSATKAEASYIGSTNSHKFHNLNSSSGKKILECNAEYFTVREDAIAAGYVPCKVCNP
jgi:micrococcal nuclease